MPVLTRPFSPLPAEQLPGTSTYGEAFEAAVGETLATGPTGAADIAMRLRRSEHPRERPPLLSEFLAPGFALYDRMRLDPIKDSPKLAPDEAAQQVKDAGLDGDIPLAKYPNIRQNTLSLLIDLNKDKRRRQTLTQEYDGWSPQIAGMVIGSVLDPSNVALSFVPVVGEARYAQLLERAGSSVVGRLGVRAGVGAVEGGVGAAIVEPAIYMGQQQWRNDYDAYDSMLNIAGGAGFGSLLHGGAGMVKDAFGRPVQTAAEVLPQPRSAFADPDMVTGEAFRAKARAEGVSERAAIALTPKAARDNVTGFFDGQQAGVKADTVQRAMLHVERTGEPAYYVSADIANLGGLNAHVGNVAEAANVHYRAMAQILQDELRATGADLVPMRTGGDELGAVVVNADAQALDMALSRVDSRIQEYAQANGLSEIPHPKGGEPGVGMHSGAAAIVPGLELTDIFTRADLGVDASKRGMVRVNRNQRAAVGAGPDTGTGAGRVPAEAVGGVRQAGAGIDPFAGIRPFISELDPSVQAAAFRQALAQAATGRPIDISPTLLADGDYSDALARANRNATLVDGAEPEAAAQAQARIDQPTPGIELEAAKQLLADDKARLAERGRTFEPEESALKIERDAVKAATMCLMRSA